VPVQEGRYFDPRHYHLGMAEANGRPKLLGRLLAAGGAERAAMVANLASPVVLRSREATVITGGAGFIGCNLADTLLEAGETVRVVDNLSRPGVEENLAWLKARHGALLQVEVADLRDPLSLGDALSGASSLFHMAAQTAVTTSLTSPVADFETNAAGTLAVLEAVRGLGGAIPVVFASTNKVYGGLDDIALAEQDGAHAPLDTGVRLYGISEEHGLDFCTPYGCSKGVADQYVLDYSKTFGVPAAVLRMSCIYGPRQFGTEDQGWVAHFLISALRGKPVTIYGDGRQVRDILYISDAVAAYRSMREHMASVAGQAFNLGGGPGNAVSVRMVLDEAADLFDLPLSVRSAA
jgi:CDP-paratose 2-epimerase